MKVTNGSPYWNHNRVSQLQSERKAEKREEMFTSIDVPVASARRHWSTLVTSRRRIDQTRRPRTRMRHNTNSIPIGLTLVTDGWVEIIIWLHTPALLKNETQRTTNKRKIIRYGYFRLEKKNDLFVAYSLAFAERKGMNDFYRLQFLFWMLSNIWTLQSCLSNLVSTYKFNKHRISFINQVKLAVWMQKIALTAEISNTIKIIFKLIVVLQAHTGRSHNPTYTICRRAVMRSGFNGGIAALQNNYNFDFISKSG